MQICADKRNFYLFFVCLFLNAMIQVIQLKGKRQTFISAFGASSNGSGCNTCK